MDKEEIILRKRAIEAAKTVQISEDEESLDLVYFTIGNEKYAIEAYIVSGVHMYATPTPVPHTPSYIEGILYMRGRFVSVLNLKSFLGMHAQNSEMTHSLLLLGNETMEFAVAVDEILEETKLSKKVIQSIPPGFDLDRKELIAGVTEEGIIVLDGKKFFSHPTMSIQQEVTTILKRSEDV